MSPRSEAYIGLVRSRHVDGLIVSGPRSDDRQLRDLEAEGFPVVLLGQMPESNLCQIDVDHQHAARTAVDYLLYRGHQRIAFIGQGPPIYTATQARLSGYAEALAAAGLPFNEALVRHGNFLRASGYAAMQSLLQLTARPAAVFVGNDTVAFGALAAVRDTSLHTPDDVAIVGFDDEPDGSRRDAAADDRSSAGPTPRPDGRRDPDETDRRGGSRRADRPAGHTPCDSPVGMRPN